MVMESWYKFQKQKAQQDYKTPIFRQRFQQLYLFFGKHQCVIIAIQKIVFV